MQKRHQKTERQGPSRGTAKFSLLSLNSKKEVAVSSKAPSPKKHIPQEPCFENQETPVYLTESPYKSSLTNIQPQLFQTNEESDFSSPLSFKNIKKPELESKKQKAPSKRPRRTRQVSLHHILKQNFRNEDVNPDHLQMALALSKSSFESENGTTEDILNGAKTQTTLEAFYTKFGITKSTTSLKNTPNEPVKRRKKSKFQYITPTLMLRTEEDRKSLINSKVSLILQEKNNLHGNIKTPIAQKLNSEVLEECHCKENRNFSSGQHADLEKAFFYVAALNLTPSKCKSGCLLKNWNQIPGRDTTPTKSPKNKLENIGEDTSTCEEITKILDATKNQLEVPIFPKQSSISPDMFDSSDDLERESPSLINVSPESKSLRRSLQNTPKKSISPEKKIGTPLNLSKVFKSESGICHFEGYSSPDGVINLLSSDDETDAEVEAICTPPNDLKMPLDVKDLEMPLNEKLSQKSFLEDSFNTSDFAIHIDIDGIKRKSLNITSYVNNMLENDLEQTLLVEEKSQNFNVSKELRSIINERDLSPEFEDFMSLDDENSALSNSQKSIFLEKPSTSFGAQEIIPIDSDDSLNQSQINDEEINYSNINSSFSQFNKQYSKKFEPCTSFTPKKTLTRTLTCANIDSPVHPIRKTQSEANITTPNNKYVLKTQNITPVPEYDSMDTPKVLRELYKFGLKPLKRKRGVMLLKHLYDATHPLVEEINDTRVEEKACVKRKKVDNSSVFLEQGENVEIVGDTLLENEKTEDLIFERRKSTKIASCQIPLQIVWHNFVCNNPKIRENILLYEPLQLEVLHNLLKEQGFKFHVQDLLTFLDKKCITIRTAQGQKSRK